MRAPGTGPGTAPVICTCWDNNCPDGTGNSCQLKTAKTAPRPASQQAGHAVIGLASTQAEYRDLGGKVDHLIQEKGNCQAWLSVVTPAD